MCGKFTAMASWSEVVDFGEAFSSTAGDGGDNDRQVGFRVMSDLAVIVFDREAGKRRVIPMRWGYPRRGNWRSPDPIHARSETIDSKPTFAPAFQKGQRGIVLVKTFNEGKQISPKVTEQHTIMLGDEPAGAIAFLFDQFSIADLTQPLAGLRHGHGAGQRAHPHPHHRTRGIRPHAGLSREGRLGDLAWRKWRARRRGQSVPEDCRRHQLENVEGRARGSKTKRAKPTVSDPKGLF